MNLPAVSRQEMIEVDRLMIEVAGISLLQMMENAGRSLAGLAIDLFGPRSVLVFAGSGGNGGGAMVAARHLANRGVTVTVNTTRSVGDLRGVPRTQADILERMGVSLISETSDTNADLVIDGVIGYTLDGAPTGPAQLAIERINSLGVPVLSLDTPSGLDVDSGTAPGDVVAPDATLTLALPKVGFERARLGDLYLADISVPQAIYQQMGLEVPPDLFAAASVIAL